MTAVRGGLCVGGEPEDHKERYGWQWIVPTELVRTFRLLGLETDFLAYIVSMHDEMRKPTPRARPAN